MPGFFGGYSPDAEPLQVLSDEFSAAWPGVDRSVRDHWILGAHAFGSQRGLLTSGSRLVAVYGPAHSRDVAASISSDAYRTEGPGNAVGPELVGLGIGSAALLAPEEDRLLLWTDVSGAFPLYYWILDDGILFSTHLRPLARATGSRADLTSVTSFLHYGYTIGRRTFFDGVRRLRPGEVLDFRSEGFRRSRVTGHSRVWSTSPELEDTSGAAWHTLRRAFEAVLDDRDSWSLMMSGGWDSRTLLASHPEGRPPKFGFSHGDIGSRELSIARAVTERAGVDARQEPIQTDVLAPDFLEDLFLKIELTIFPYWCRSARVQRRLGSECVVAGVYGEVLGGHYGPAMLAHGLGKIAAVGKGLLGWGVDGTVVGEEAVASIRDFLLGTGDRDRPTGLSPDVWASDRDRKEALRSRVDGHLSWLLDRGVPTAERLVEAFLTEHRGAQYIFGQLRSSTAVLDVAAPFCHPEVMRLAGSLSLSQKIHNRVNRRVLDQYAAELLEFPLAATLVPASRPILWQEASRLARKIREESHWWLHRRTGGAVPAPRLAWINFESFRGTGTLPRLADELESDLWHQEEVKQLARRADKGDWPGSIHSVAHRLLKLHTVEMMLR